MTLITEVDFPLQLLLNANLLQTSIRERTQTVPCDLLCWATEIRNLRDRIKNNKLISSFNYWRPTSKSLLPLSEIFVSQILTRFVDSPFREVLQPADRYHCLIRRAEAVAWGRNCGERTLSIRHVHLVVSAVKVNQTGNVPLTIQLHSPTAQATAIRRKQSSTWRV